MGFMKKANGEVTSLKLDDSNRHNISALNVPEGGLWDVYTDDFKRPIEKSAKLYKGTVDLNGFDIEAEINKNPDHLFVKVLAIKKDEVNENGDAFPECELKKSAETFIGVPVFCNHQNDDIEKARGKVVHAWYDDKAEGIYTINMVDSVAYPSLARGIEEGYIIGTSMGCSVEASMCSVCGSVAETADHYCSHIRNQKNRTFSGKTKFAYGENGITLKGYDDCPIKFPVDDSGNVVHEAQKVYEYNFGIRFIEDSFVVNPACPECLVQEVLNSGTVQRKVASAVEAIGKFKKLASCNTGSCSITKTAGKEELNDLTQAMDKLEKIAKSMMAQKEHVSMEYVSDIVKSLSDLQAVSDELIENGYGQLPSPDIQSINNANISTAEGAETPENSSFTGQQPQSTPGPPQPAAAQSSQLDQGIGSVTKPTFAKNQDKIKDFNPESRIQREAEHYANHSDSRTLKTQSEMESKKMAQKQGNSGNKQEKEASYGVNGHQSTDHITEKQLEEKSGEDYAGSRDVYKADVITEKQLENAPDVNHTTTASPLKRTEAYEVITEKQLESIQSGYITRWDQLPDVITEKQWTDISRAVGSQLSADQGEHITEKQLADFLDHHRYILPSVITEKQLPTEGSELTDRWAFSENLDRLIKAATASVAGAIRSYGKTPSELKRAIAKISDNKDKAAAGVLVNAAPYKKEALASESERYEYFGLKTASTISPVDALVFAMAENVSDMSASDLVEVVASVLDNDKSLKKAEELSKQKKESKEEKSLSKKAQIEKALQGLDRDSDGEYEFVFPLSQIAASQNHKSEFVNQVRKLAYAEINSNVGEDLDLQLLRIEIDKDDNQTAYAFVKETSKLNEEEKVALAELEGRLVKEASNNPIRKPITKEARAAKRSKLVKEAQLFGGEMGGQGGVSQAPGAGMGAAAPGADPAGMNAQQPVESFEDSAMEDELGDEDENTQPKPPGAVCAACASEDVDVVDGKGKCNNCGAEYTFKIQVEFSKYPGIMEGEQKGEEGEDEFAGEGVELPEEEAGGGMPDPSMGPGMGGGGGMGGMPAAAASREGVKFNKFAYVTRITPKIAEKAGKFQLGTVSPITGTTNTVKLASGSRLCQDTNIAYDFDILVDSKNPKNIFAQWAWNPVSPLTTTKCDSCSRSKKVFASALEKAGLTPEKFDNLSWADKAKAILDLENKKAFASIKTASAKNSTSIVDEIVKTAQASSKFPIEDCMEKIARRYGENALALSGPCEGKSLAECACNRMKTAGINSTIATMKVADIWADKDACEECKEDRVREGFTLKQAETACNRLAEIYAQFDDKLAQEVASIEIEGPALPVNEEVFNEGMEEDGPFGEEEVPMDGDMDSGMDGDMDGELGSDMGGGDEVANALADLVKSLGKTEEVDQILDSELGESPEDIAAEPHHDDADLVVDTVDDGGLDMPEGPEDVAEDIVEEVTESKGMEGCCEPESKQMMGGDMGMEAPEEKSLGMGCGEKAMAEENSEEKEGNCPCDDNKEDTNNNPGVMNQDESDVEVEKEGEEEDEDEDAKEMAMYSEANKLRRGYIGRVGEINMDIESILAGLNKSAQKVNVQTAQDAAKAAGAADWSSSTIGEEKPFSANQPDVPSSKSKSLIKNEKDNKALSKDEKAETYSGDGKIGKEELDSELTDKATGGTDGQGSSKAANSKDKLTALAESIMRIREAQEKKVEVKQNQDDKDAQTPHKSKPTQYLGDEKSSIGDVPKSEKYPNSIKDVKDKDQFLGNEKESIGDRPSEKDTPNTPSTADGRIGGEKDNDKIKSEKAHQMEGKQNNSSVQASGLTDPKVAGVEKATKVAGRLLQTGKISINDLPARIAEFSSYSTEALEAIEKLALTPQAGLQTGPDGLEKAIVMEKTASVDNGKDDLMKKIQGLFSLQAQSDEADLTLENLRKTFNK